MPSLVSVRPSAIEGLGVFASAPLATGDLILVLDDSYLVGPGNPVPAGEEIHCDFLEDGKVVWMQAPERHINHSCDPNVFVRTVNARRHLLALRPISPAEEIVYDYSINGFGDTVWQCSCHAPRCRRNVHSNFFHLPLPLQREYLPLLDAWFRHEHTAELKALDDLAAF